MDNIKTNNSIIDINELIRYIEPVDIKYMITPSSFTKDDLITINL